MKKDDEILITIWSVIKTTLTVLCIALTIGLLVIKPESVGDVFADTWWAYGALLVINLVELIKYKFFTTK